MTTTVTLALVGDPAQPQEGQQGGRITGDGRPYWELPKVDLEMESSQTLSEVFAQGLREWNVDVGDGIVVPSWIAFYVPEDDVAYRPTRESPVVELVTEDGKAIWGTWLHDESITIEAMIASAQAGAIHGDPRRPYLILRPGYGNGLVPDWAELVQMLLALRGALSLIADLHAAGSVLTSIKEWAGRVRERFRRVPEIVEANGGSWASRGGFPQHIELFLDRQPWRPEVLAPLLGTSIDETKVLLSGRGFVPDANGLWQPNGDSDGRRLRQTLDVMYTAEWWSATEDEDGVSQLADELRDRIIEHFQGLDDESE